MNDRYRPEPGLVPPPVVVVPSRHTPQTVRGGFSWDELVGDNPMLVEFDRFRRKYLRFGGRNTVGTIVLATLVLAFLGLIFLILPRQGGGGDIPPGAIIMGQTVLLCLLAPLLLHGTIAGERERRSWEILLVAPVTKSQIVAGKYLAALAGAAGAIGVMSFPVVLAALTYRSTSYGLGSGVGFGELLMAEILSFVSVAFVCAVSLFFSARVRRPLMALGVTLGLIVGFFVALPGLVGTFGGQIAGEAVIWLNPVVTMGSLLFSSGSTRSSIADSVLISLVFALLTAVIFVWTVASLTFAENDVKFLPRLPEDQERA